MTTKRIPRMRARHVTELSPAATYYLVCGIFPHQHVCGALDYKTWRCEADLTLPPCVPAMPIPGGMKLLMEDNAAEIWQAHRDTLIAEAKAHGFIAAGAQWFDTGRLPLDEPIDPAATAGWRREFVERFGGRFARTGKSKEAHEADE